MDWETVRQEFADLVLFEILSTREINEQPFTKRTRDARNELSERLLQISRAGGPDDIGEMLKIERIFLVAERRHMANTDSMAASLDTAIDDLDAAMIMLEESGEPERYRFVADRVLSRPKNRVGGLPDDQARQFFRSHHTRLENIRKGRGTDSEKRVLACRILSLKNSEKLYIARQRSVLDIKNPAQDTGLDR